jgi:predicted  nucleic acid-binding Zn-ribbon protein
MKSDTICANCGHVYDVSKYDKKLSKVECPNCGSTKKKTKVELEEGDEPGLDR